MIKQSIPLAKGWNLISFPYDPVEARITDVFRNTSAYMVLGYRNGEWATAFLDGDGLWRGTLSKISGGYGYWVNASDDETLIIAVRDIARVRVVKGWNLLGVIGEQQQDADAYLDMIAWRVANTLERPVGNVDEDAHWREVHPGEHGALYPHKGYWVWSAGKPVTIERAAGAPVSAI